MTERGRTMYRAGETLSSEELEALVLRRRDDKRAVQTIVAAMTKLVVYWATPYKAAGVLPLEDLIQEGMLGLCEAIEEYRPGGNFHSLVWFNVRCRCSRAIKKARRAVVMKNGRSGVHILPRELYEAEVESIRRFGTDHSAQVAEVLGTTIDRVDTAKLRYRKDKSMDAPYGPSARGEDGAELTLHGKLEGTDANAEERAMWQELHGHLARAVESFRAKLSPRERRVFDARIIADEVIIGRALGEELGCSRQRIEQIESPLREKFFAYVREHVS